MFRDLNGWVEVSILTGALCQVLPKLAMKNWVTDDYQTDDDRGIVRCAFLQVCKRTQRNTEKNAVH